MVLPKGNTFTNIILLLVWMMAGTTSCLKDKTDGISTGVEVGNTAPDFSLPDAQGNMHTLSGYRGNLILVEFWASWCTFCREENPELVTLYDTYKEKGFEILGVSLDTSKDAWQNAVSADRLNYITLSDLRGFDSSAAKIYQVKSIPKMFLIDENGTILLVTTSASVVAQRLEQHYN